MKYCGFASQSPPQKAFVSFFRKCFAKHIIYMLMADDELAFLCQQIVTSGLLIEYCGFSVTSQSPPQKADVCFSVQILTFLPSVYTDTLPYSKVSDLCKRHHYMLMPNFQTLWETSDEHLCQNVFSSGGGTQLLNTISFCLPIDISALLWLVFLDSGEGGW